MKQWFTQGNDIRYGRQISGQGAIMQRHEHLLATDPGDLLSDPEWGKKLKALLGQVNGDTTVLEDIFRAQHLRDVETDTAEVSIQYENGRLRYGVIITSKTGTVATLEKEFVE
jgi:phage baseplate assembly protein W